MPDKYNGVDRREHCENHEHHTETIEANTVQLAGINSGVSILKWVVGLGLPALIAIFVSANDKLDKINTMVQSMAMEQKEVSLKVGYQDKDISEIKDRLCKLEVMPKK